MIGVPSTDLMQGVLDEHCNAEDSVFALLPRETNPLLRTKRESQIEHSMDCYCCLLSIDPHYDSARQSFLQDVIFVASSSDVQTSSRIEYHFVVDPERGGEYAKAAFVRVAIWF